MKKMPNKGTRRTSDAGVVLNRMTGDDPILHRLVETARENARVGQLIFDARAKAKLTQKELAKLAGTTQTVISRLEDANYEGHSLSMLGRIAAALERRVEIRFVRSPRGKGVVLTKPQPSLAGSRSVPI